MISIINIEYFKFVVYRFNLLPRCIDNLNISDQRVSKTTQESKPSSNLEFTEARKMTEGNCPNACNNGKHISIALVSMIFSFFKILIIPTTDRTQQPEFE